MPTIEKRPCEFCEVVFTPRRRKGRFCSDQCRWRYHLSMRYLDAGHPEKALKFIENITVTVAEFAKSSNKSQSAIRSAIRRGRLGAIKLPALVLIPKRSSICQTKLS
jgi:hypothetical protein